MVLDLLGCLFLISIPIIHYLLFEGKTMDDVCLQVAIMDMKCVHGETYEPLEEPEFAMWLDLGEM